MNLFFSSRLSRVCYRPLLFFCCHYLQYFILIQHVQWSLEVQSACTILPMQLLGGVGRKGKEEKLTWIWHNPTQPNQNSRWYVTRPTTTFGQEGHLCESCDVRVRMALNCTSPTATDKKELLMMYYNPNLYA